MKKLFALLMMCSFVAIAEPIDINKADADTLAKALNGVGPKKAEAIIQYRKDHGDFKTLKDLENVKGIGEKLAKAVEKDIVFGETAAAAAKPAEKVEPAKKTK